MKLFEKFVGWSFNNPEKLLLIIIISKLITFGLIVWAALHFIAKFW